MFVIDITVEKRVVWEINRFVERWKRRNIETKEETLALAECPNSRFPRLFQNCPKTITSSFSK